MPLLRVAAALVLLAFLTTAPRPARAAADPAPAPERQAREAFQRAEMRFNLGKFAEALADYQAAYQAKPLPAFLFNVAQCYRNLHDYERARFFYRRYLVLDPHGANRRLVEDLIGEMTRALQKGGSAPPARDQTAPTPAPAPTSTPAPVNLVPASASPPTTLVAGAEGSHPRDEQRARLYQRWWLWAGAGAVVAAAVLIGVFATRSETPRGSLGTIDGRP